MPEIEKSNSEALASLIMGILSLLIPFSGIVLAILGLFFASSGKKKLLYLESLV